MVDLYLRDLGIVPGQALRRTTAGVFGKTC